MAARFWRRSQESTPLLQDPEEAQVEQVAPKEAGLLLANAVTEGSIGAAAVSKAVASEEVSGFESRNVATDTGGSIELLVPSGRVPVNMERTETGLVTDKRRITPESIEADFQTEKERLESPLDEAEFYRTLDIIEQQAEGRGWLKEQDQPSEYFVDAAVAIVKKVDSLRKRTPHEKYLVATNTSGTLYGEPILAATVSNKGEILPVSEIMNSIVQSFYKAGVGPAEHGYDTSNAYYHILARRIAAKLETMPREIRERVLEAQESDALWVVDEPLVSKDAPLD